MVLLDIFFNKNTIFFILFQRLPLELVSLQDYNLCNTLFSSSFVNDEKIGQVHWLGEGDYLCCQEDLFLDSSPTEFSANGSLLAHAYRHMPMRMRKEEFHHHFPFNSRHLTPIKMAAVFDQLLKDVPLQCQYLVLQKVKLVFT